MAMETREKTFCLVARVIGSSSLALMTGTPSLPWMIHLSQVVSISIILIGMVAELICCAFVIGSCYDSKISSPLYKLIGFSLALVIGASSLALIICTSLLALIGTSSLAWVIHISHVSSSIILFGEEAEQIYFLFSGILYDYVKRSDGSRSFPIGYSKIKSVRDAVTFGYYFGIILSADSVCKTISNITSPDKPKSSVYSKNGRICLGIRTSLSFFFELCFPELGLAIDLSEVSICISLFGMVALAEISLQVRVKKHGQGQSSSGPAGGSGAGNAGGSIGGGGDENGTIGHGTGQGRRSGMGVGGQGRGNDDDDGNDGGRVVGNLEDGRRPRNPTPEEIATIFLPIIIQSVAIIMSLNDAELSTTGRVIRYLSMIINSVGFICCAAVLWQPYTNPRVARILNRRITGFFSRIGSALAVLGFISMMSVDLPLYPSLIMGLAFLLLLAIFLMDISEALQ